MFFSSLGRATWACYQEQLECRGIAGKCPWLNTLTRMQPNLRTHSCKVLQRFARSGDCERYRRKNQLGANFRCAKLHGVVRHGMAPAVGAKAGFHGCHDAKDVEDGRIRGDLQIEVNKAVNQYAGAAEHGS